MSRRKPKATLTDRQAEQAIKVMTVMLRDESRMTLGEVIEALCYCWRHTETVAQSVAREHPERSA